MYFARWTRSSLGVGVVARSRKSLVGLVGLGRARDGVVVAMFCCDACGVAMIAVVVDCPAVEVV